MDNSIIVKRPVVIKTVVTNDFKSQAINEIEKELRLVDNQIMQLEIQNKQISDQFSANVNSFNEDSLKQIQDTINELLKKIEQMSDLKTDLVSQKETISRLMNDNIIVTGSLENYVKLSVGENLYSKFKEAEIIVKDGIIQEINA